MIVVALILFALLLLSVLTIRKRNRTVSALQSDVADLEQRLAIRTSERDHHESMSRTLRDYLKSAEDEVRDLRLRNFTLRDEVEALRNPPTPDPVPSAPAPAKVTKRSPARKPKK